MTDGANNSALAASRPGFCQQHNTNIRTSLPMTKPSSPAPQNGQPEADPVQAGQQETHCAKEAPGVVDKASEKPQVEPAIEPELKPEPKTEVEAASEGKTSKDKPPESAPKEKKAQDDAKAALEKQEKEAKDRRSQVRKAVQVPAPEINKTPAKASPQPGVAKHDFA